MAKQERERELNILKGSFKKKDQKVFTFKCIKMAAS